MGIFSRLRPSSSTVNLPLGSPSTADLHASPHPSTPAASSTHLSLNPPSSGRLSHPPSSPSASSVTSRISKRTWKTWRTDDSQKGSQKSKGKGKGKGRESEVVAEDDVGGPRYDDFSPVPPVPSSALLTPKSYGTPNTKGSVRKPPLLNLGEVPGGVQPNSPSSPLSRFETSFGDDEEKEELDREAERKRKAKFSSAFRKEGGILGKLNFESGGLGIEEGGGEKDMPNEPVRGDIEVPEPASVPLRPVNSFNGTTTTSETTESVFVDSGNETPERTEDIRVGTPPPRRAGEAEEDPMEVLESAEKKPKFWKIGRRQSRAMSVSDVPEFGRSASPTPHKTTPNSNSVDIPNSSRNSVDIVQPRPQALRRPSSSLFTNTFNPFNRSASRASERSPIVDDGSFQLKGFRHVSGMSDVEGAGELEGYLTHVKRDSVLALEKPGTPTPGEAASPPVAFTTRVKPPTMVPIPRPPSAANSVTSMDELVSQSNRVSVAAFRRGIRRPSEGVATMSDLGHGIPVDLDDDDVPLAVRRASHHPLPRKQSSLSLSSVPLEAEKVESPSLKQLGEEIERRDSPSLKQLGEGIERKDSPLSFQVKHHHKPGTGFVVKGRSPRGQQDALPPNMGLASPPAGPSSELRPAVFATPPSTRGPSPNIQAMGESGHMMSSPVDLCPVDSYFMRGAPSQSDQVRKTAAPVPLNMLKSRPGYGEHAFPSPLATGQQAPGQYSGSPNPNQTSSPGSNTTRSPDRPPPPPVAPLDLPEAEDPLSGLALNLPLPPDQMPDTPPKAPKPLSELPSRRPGFSPDASASPNTQRKRMSLLDEPMRIISGLWNSPAAGEDAFDPALVVSSMRMYGEDSPGSPKEKEKEVEAGSPLPARGPGGTLEHQRSHSTLFDMGTVTPLETAATPLERTRSPLSERLAGVANSAKGSSMSSFASLQKPALRKIQTEKMEKIQTEKMEAGTGMGAGQVKSPVSDSTPVGPAGPTLGSSFIPRGPVPSKDESSESESDGSDTEGENSSAAYHRQHQRLQQQPLLPSSASRDSSRRVPSGPRKPSLSVRQSRMVSMPSMNSQGHQAVRPSTRKEESSDSEDDRPLSVVKTRSRSSLAAPAAAKSPPYGQAALPSPPISVATTIASSKSSPAVAASGDPRMASKPLVELGPIVNAGLLAARREGSILELHSSTTLTSSSVTSTPSSAKASLPSPASRAQVRFASPEKGKEARRKTASPESAQSGATGESGFYGPLTPRSGEVGLGLRMDQGRSQVSQSFFRIVKRADEKQNDQRGNARLRRQSQGNMQAYDPPAQLAMQQAQQQGMQQNMQNMSPEAMQFAMKQQWQMNVVAAALRASEEEWERQSSTSAGTSSTTPHFNGGFPMPPMPMFPPMNMGMMNPNMMGMGMGMPGGYGYPQSPGPGGGGGGGYSYGPGAQSAYGGNFGPPSTMPSQQRRASHKSSAATLSHAQGGGSAPSSRITSTYLPHDSRDREAREMPRQRSASAMGTADARPGFTGLLAEREKAEAREREEAARKRERDERELQKYRARERGASIDGESEAGRRGREVSPPPSSWRRSGRTASGDWSDVQGTPRKARPKSQFVN
ncbi:hypothetical protein IAT38_004010 [Cryptococcus sp. DSM 104549]